MTIRSILLIIFFTVFTARASAFYSFKCSEARDTVYADRLFRKAVFFDIRADYDSALFYYRSAAGQYRKKRHYTEYLNCRNKMISVKRSAGYHEGLIAEAKENIVLSIKRLGGKSAVTADCYLTLGNVYSDDRDLDSALIYYQSALDILNGNDNNNDLPKADIYRNKGVVFSKKGLLDSARNNISKSLSLRLPHYGEYDHRLAPDYNSLGTIAYHLGQYDECEDYFRKVVKIREKTGGYSHPLTAEAYNNLAVLFMAKANWDSALVTNLKAYNIRKEKLPLNHKDIALSLNNLGNTYMAMGDLESALENHSRALRIRLAIHGTVDHTDIAMSYTNIGVLLRQMGRYREAMEYFKGALDILLKIPGEDSPYTASAYNNVGAAYDDMGDYDNCLEYLKKALSLRLKRGSHDPGVPSSYNNIGSAYKKKGDLDLALSYYRRSLEINKTLFDDPHSDIARNNRHIGEVFLLRNEYDTALYHFNTALDIDSCVYGMDNPSVIQDYLNLGRTFGKLKNPGQALQNYRKGLRISSRAYGINHPETADLFSEMALAFMEKHQPDSARYYMKKAVNIIGGFFPVPHPALSSSYRDMGWVYENAGLTDSAEIFYNRSLQANYQGDLNSDRIDHSLIMHRSQFASTLFDLSRLKYNEFYRERNAWSLKQILYNFDNIKTITRATVSDFLLEETRIGLMNQLSDQTVFAVDAACRLFYETGDREYFFKALEFSELNKASILQNLTSRFSGRSRVRIPDTLIYKQKELLGYIDYLQLQLKKNRNENGKRPEKNQEQLDSLLISLREINDTINKYAGIDEDYSISGGRELYEAITAQLDTTSALVSYFLSDSLIFTLIVSLDTLVLHRRLIDPADRPDQLIHDYLSSLRKYEKEKVLQLSSTVYDLVFGDIEGLVRDKKRLIIIPDKQLLYLPFETLCKNYTRPERFSDFMDQSYLIKDFEIVYHYSAGLWITSGTQSEPDATGLVAFAPVFMYQMNDDISRQTVMKSGNLSSKGEFLLNGNQSGYFPELPFTRQEADTLGSICKRYGIGSEIFTGAAATETNFRKNINNYRYVHIATHALIDDSYPENSGLVFADFANMPDSAMVQRDDGVEGILFASEIYPLNINADLVTMSACETGSGKLEEGEGVVGLVRGFLSAGARNVLYSYWKVGDETTMNLMRDFYNYTLSGVSYGTALRKARLKMLNDPETSFPLLWGAFGIIGNQREDKQTCR